METTSQRKLWRTAVVGLGRKGKMWKKCGEEIGRVDEERDGKERDAIRLRRRNEKETLLG